MRTPYVSDPYYTLGRLYGILRDRDGLQTPELQVHRALAALAEHDAARREEEER